MALRTFGIDYHLNVTTITNKHQQHFLKFLFMFNFQTNIFNLYCLVNYKLPNLTFLEMKFKIINSRWSFYMKEHAKAVLSLKRFLIYQNLAPYEKTSIPENHFNFTWVTQQMKNNEISWRSKSA